MERSVLLFFCILCTLVTSGFSLSCTMCNAVDEKSCKGPSTECPEGSDVCMATYEYNTLDGQEMSEYRRSCGPRTSCSKKESLTTSDGEIKISSTCCFTSNCVPPMPVLPHTKTEKNGISCMDCRGFEDKLCTSSTYRDCTGDEQKCFSAMITTKSSPMKGSLRGCGTVGWCNVSGFPIMTKKIRQEMEFTCHDGSQSLQHCLFLVIFASMLLAKIIG